MGRGRVIKRGGQDYCPQETPLAAGISSVLASEGT